MNGRVENDLKIYKNVEKQLKDLPPYVTSWYFYLKANNQSASTCQDYIRKIRLFLSFINDKIKTVSIEQINEDIITSYFINIQYKSDGTETSDSYRQGVWSCLNNFFDFLESRNMIDRNVIKTSKIKRPKNKDLERINQNRKLLTQDDFNNILLAVENEEETDGIKVVHNKYKNRDKLIMLIFMTTGIRRTALMEINVEDIDTERHRLTVIDKGHKVHYYYLNDMVIDAFDKWIEDRNCLVDNTNGALFISKDKKRMCGNSIAKIVDKYSTKGLGYHISPHKLRSGLISIMYNKKHDVEFCRRMIGHSNIATTQRYIVTNNNEREETANMMAEILI